MSERKFRFCPVCERVTEINPQNGNCKKCWVPMEREKPMDDDDYNRALGSVFAAEIDKAIVELSADDKWLFLSARVKRKNGRLTFVRVQVEDGPKSTPYEQALCEKYFEKTKKDEE